MKQNLLFTLLVMLPLTILAQNNSVYNLPSSWSEDTKKMCTEFLDNYKSAYREKNIDFFRQIFSDDVLIIDENDIISNKKNYQLNKLDVLFRCKGLVDIRYINCEILRLEIKKDKELYSFQIWQEFCTPKKKEKGYLFMMVDMTNHMRPQIIIHTWQPNEENKEKWYSAGNFIL